MIPILLTILFVVPHGDDETTLLPLIQQAGPDAVVLVMTDGAASVHCPPVDCEAARRASTMGFLDEMAPEATLIWVGEPDRGLTVERIAFWIGNLCPSDCEIWAASADYPHPDHQAVRAAVAMYRGRHYNGETRDDPEAEAAFRRWYGWLGPWPADRMSLVGLR